MAGLAANIEVPVDKVAVTVEVELTTIMMGLYMQPKLGEVMVIQVRVEPHEPLEKAGIHYMPEAEGVEMLITECKVQVVMVEAVREAMDIQEEMTLLPILEAVEVAAVQPHGMAGLVEMEVPASF